MLKQSFRLILVCLAIASPCLPPAAKAHPNTDDSVQDRLCLSEVLISTPPSDTPAQITGASHKAEALRKEAQSGSSFADLAKANSQGPTAGRVDLLDVSSGVNCPRNLQSVCFACSPVKYPMCCVRSKVS